MEARLEEMDADIAFLARLIIDVRGVQRRLVAAADRTRPGDKAFHTRLTAAVAQVNLLGRVQHGMVVQLLARAQEHRAMPGGAPAWLSSTQGISNGHARTLVNDAKHLTAHAEITEHLTEGSLSPDATRVLARTLKALADADAETQRQAVGEVISEIQAKGVTQAAKLIPQLEKRADTRGAEEILATQRARSYARVTELDDGAHRYNMLLDAERSTYVNAALETYAADVYDRRQCGDVEVLPAHVHTTEQIAAHAFTRLAETFLDTDEAQYETALETPSVLDVTLETTECPAESVHDQPRPASALPDPHAPRAGTGPADTDEQAAAPNDAHVTDSPWVHRVRSLAAPRPLRQAFQKRGAG
jgi:hypothetical protein